MVNDTKYKALSRINETVIYLNIDKEYKKEVQRILKKLGYYFFKNYDIILLIETEIVVVLIVIRNLVVDEN